MPGINQMPPQYLSGHQLPQQQQQSWMLPSIPSVHPGYLHPINMSNYNANTIINHNYYYQSTISEMSPFNPPGNVGQHDNSSTMTISMQSDIDEPDTTSMFLSDTISEIIDVNSLHDHYPSQPVVIQPPPQSQPQSQSQSQPQQPEQQQQPSSSSYDQSQPLLDECEFDDILPNVDSIFAEQHPEQEQSFSNTLRSIVYGIDQLPSTPEDDGPLIDNTPPQDTTHDSESQSSTPPSSPMSLSSSQEIPGVPTSEPSSDDHSMEYPSSPCSSSSEYGAVPDGCPSPKPRAKRVAKPRAKCVNRKVSDKPRKPNKSVRFSIRMRDLLKPQSKVARKKDMDTSTLSRRVNHLFELIMTTTTNDRLRSFLEYMYADRQISWPHRIFTKRATHLHEGYEDFLTYFEHDVEVPFKKNKAPSSPSSAKKNKKSTSSSPSSAKKMKLSSSKKVRPPGPCGGRDE
ncbi:hypothetical protein SAMD00019534_055890 [Acytostelium subglobosum LB1]|uniref:hypothetical protein n=1 Tax=Acytostelium subglobosum LB1 TaxID=1410327 RepID=UPI000644A8EA|nr:hypothetical protein SAMD00019534_055890 [Acytostelium subglobosum LB1]GAM22414.1 hypothetical protein SAMD00019534_055890 [Acytostelium subglobosum LB1]|eukprot:XP_012754534.1 hypothetical protein SAMD00019534_055890 [Acytostelium subglobosum LB1]